MILWLIAPIVAARQATVFEDVELYVFATYERSAVFDRHSVQVTFSGVPVERDRLTSIVRLAETCLETCLSSRFASGLIRFGLRDGLLVLRLLKRPIETRTTAH